MMETQTGVGRSPDEGTLRGQGLVNKDLVIESLLTLFMLLALWYMIRTAFAAYRPAHEVIAWKRQCRVVGLILGFVAWLSALGIIVTGELRLDSVGPLIPGLLLVGTFATPVALVMGVVTRTRLGYFLAKAEAMQALFWVLLWLWIPRAVL